MFIFVFECFHPIFAPSLAERHVKVKYVYMFLFRNTSLFFSSLSFQNLFIRRPSMKVPCVTSEEQYFFHYKCKQGINARHH